MKDSNCPYCDSESTELFSAHDVNRGVTEHVFLYRECLTCGLIFLSDIPSNISLYYEEEYYKIPTVENIKKYGKKLQYQVDMISEHFPVGGRLLEIGPAFGVFAYQAKKNGYIVDAIEISESCCDFLYDKLNINVYRSDNPTEVISDINYLYDIVVLWHNIEHLTEPWKLLDAVAEKIQNGGIVIIASPNPESFSFKFLRSLWPHLDAPRHIYLIPDKLLSNKMYSLGFNLINKTTNDKGGLRWNIFSWQKFLMNSLSTTRFERVFYLIGLVISQMLSPIERNIFKEVAYR